MVSEMLANGRANAVSTADLCKLLGLSVPALRRAVRRERCEGALICTDFHTGGYFVAADRTEAENFAASQRKRARCAFATSRPAREVLRQFDGQESLPL